MKIIDVKIQWTRKNYDAAKEKTIVEAFQMPIPTEVKLFLTDLTLDKMKEAAQLTSSFRFNKIEFISSTLKNTEHSKVEFYKNGQIIMPAQYEDMERYVDIVDSDHFSIIKTSHNKSFVAKFLYSNSTCAEFSFETCGFAI